METRLRMLLVLAGMPEPTVNRTLRTEDGLPLRRYDVSYPAVRVIVEYDGRPHVERIEQWESDLERREAIDDDGWRILVVTSSGIYKRPEDTVVRVWRLLLRRACPAYRAVPRMPGGRTFRDIASAIVTSWVGAPVLTAGGGAGPPVPGHLPCFDPSGDRSSTLPRVALADRLHAATVAP